MGQIEEEKAGLRTAARVCHVAVNCNSELQSSIRKIERVCVSVSVNACVCAHMGVDLSLSSQHTRVCVVARGQGGVQAVF